MNDAGPLGSESDARVDDNNDGHGRRCAVHTGHGEVNRGSNNGYLSHVSSPAHPDRYT